MRRERSGRTLHLGVLRAALHEMNEPTPTKPLVRCPECEHRDIVITHRLAAAVWLRRGESAAKALNALADALADGLELGFQVPTWDW
jgi:hypothetical protein